jgi:predicted transcriptional regulator
MGRKKDRTFRLGNLQLRIMRVLWERGEAAVAEVQQQVGGDDLAYTTIATMLRKMEDRGLVAHAEDGRRFMYRAAVSMEDVTRSMTGDLVDRLFGGSLTDAVTHLLDSRDVSREELVRLEQLIRARKSQP